jgi:hypothetical protein
VSPNNIRQFYCDQSAGRNGQNSSYGLWVNLNAYMIDGTVVQLLRGCSPSKGKFLESKLEEKLGILPQHVTGEYAG